MENNRKTELLNFLNYVPEDELVGIYYLDKTLDIAHYSIYSFAELDVLREKLKSFNDSLEDSLMKILLWKSSPSEEYLVGVYEGLSDPEVIQTVNQMKEVEP